MFVSHILQFTKHRFYRVNLNVYAEDHSLWESHIKFKTNFISGFLGYFFPYYGWHSVFLKREEGYVCVYFMLLIHFSYH